MGTFLEVEFIHCGQSNYHHIGINNSDENLLLTLMSGVRNMDHNCMIITRSLTGVTVVERFGITFPLLGAADSETGRVVTPWRVMRGVKSIPRHTMHLPQDVNPWILS